MLFRQPSPRNAPRPRPVRPGVEVLEDRCVPATLTVTDPGDAGPNTLRGLIAAANPGDTINFAPTATTIQLTSGSLDVTRSLNINGPGSGLLTVGRSASAPGFGIFVVESGVTANLVGLTVTGGSAQLGAGIQNNGTLNLDRVVVTGNVGTTGGLGAGI